MRNNRIYYRNPFFHIGHLQTLFYNDRFATEQGGKCYAIVDDRNHPDSFTKIQEDFAYLELKSMIIVSIQRHAGIISLETKKLIREGRVYMLCGKSTFTDADYITECLEATTLTHFQLRLKSDNTTICFVKQEPQGLAVVYLFEYIIKVLDQTYNITDITSDSLNGNEGLNVLPLKLYTINHFRYAKKQWPTDGIYNPCLLTLKGLQARHVPKAVLYEFYEDACMSGQTSIARFNHLLEGHLNRVAVPFGGIIDPLRVDLDTGQTIYIEQEDFGLDHPLKLLRDRACNLSTGGRITCTEVVFNGQGVDRLRATFASAADPALRTIMNIEAAQSIPVVYQCYNWWYTGLNTIMKPVVYTGYTAEGMVPGVIYRISNNFCIKGDQGILSICKA